MGSSAGCLMPRTAARRSRRSPTKAAKPRAGRPTRSTPPRSGSTRSGTTSRRRSRPCCGGCGSTPATSSTALEPPATIRPPEIRGRPNFCMATTSSVPQTEAEWREAYALTPERDAPFSPPSGVPVKPLYTEADLPDAKAIGVPGGYPFTRGVYPSMYRGRLWTMRQFAGFGTAEETNERFRYLLDHGQTGLSTAFDMPSLMGHDSDSPRPLGEVGREGVAIDTLDDMETLFRGIDLGDVSVSMTINAPAAMMMAFYVVAAEDKAIPPDQLGGTIQTDILKEYIAQKEWCFPVDPAMRLVTDMMQPCARNMPRWHPVSISGYHIREAGSTAAQELAFTLKDGF